MLKRKRQTKRKTRFESFKSFYDYEKRVAEVLAANQPQRTKLNEWKKRNLPLWQSVYAAIEKGGE